MLAIKRGARPIENQRDVLQIAIRAAHGLDPGKMMKINNAGEFFFETSTFIR